MPKDPLIHIDMVSDIICPWCYVGKKRFEKALELEGVQDHVSYEYQPYMLHTKIPLEGKPTKFLKGKEAAIDLLIESGKQIDINFRFDLIQRVPNTKRLHVALKNISDPKDQWNVKRKLFEAYFTEGKDLSNDDIVTEIFNSLGFSADFIEKDQGASWSLAKNEHVRAVPTFFINQDLSVSGALEIAQWQRFLRKNLK